MNMRIVTLSLHDALPILGDEMLKSVAARLQAALREEDSIARMGGDEFTVLLPELSNPEHAASDAGDGVLDRKSTRLNSSHRCISYAVFCLKKKKSQT